MLHLMIPKGRIHTNVVNLLDEAGYGLHFHPRSYRPHVRDPELSVKIMKPQNIAPLVEMGSHDAGFTGRDWIQETGAQVVELMDLGLDPVQIVAAIPQDMDEQTLHGRKIVVASEYKAIAETFLQEQGYRYVLLQTYGATEVFPPEDADMIVDNTSTGRTLQENDLKIIATLLTSSTCFIANVKALEDPVKREKLEHMQLLFQSILDARSRVMLEMNVGKDDLQKLVSILPCMQAPTVSPLYNGDGYAIKVAVKREETASLIPRLKQLGATDILEYNFRKVVI